MDITKFERETILRYLGDSPEEIAAVQTRNGEGMAVSLWWSCPRCARVVTLGEIEACARSRGIAQSRAPVSTTVSLRQRGKR